MKNVPPPPPPAPLAVLAESGWALTMPTVPSRVEQSAWFYFAHTYVHDVRLAAETQPGYCDFATTTDYTLTGPTDRPSLLELWWLHLVQPPETAVVATALAATAAPFYTPRPRDLAHLLTAAGWREDPPMPDYPRRPGGQVHTSPNGDFQVAFLPAEHAKPEAVWLLIQHLSDGRCIKSFASWNTPTPVLTSYLLVASQPD